MGEAQIIVVAFVVAGDTREASETALLPLLDLITGGPVEEHWVAEDDRRDESDEDSVVFCAPGSQVASSALLHAHGLTEQYNVIQPRVGRWTR